MYSSHLFFLWLPAERRGMCHVSGQGLAHALTLASTSQKKFRFNNISLNSSVNEYRTSIPALNFVSVHTAKYASDSSFVIVRESCVQAPPCAQK